jgi:hypothetical protein
LASTLPFSRNFELRLIEFLSDSISVHLAATILAQLVYPSIRIPAPHKAELDSTLDDFSRSQRPFL